MRWQIEHPKERFFRKVEMIPFHTCWEWTAGKDGFGYGMFTFNKRSRRAHILSWEWHNNKSASGLFVCHKCDNPGCVNPDHLFLGTIQDNNLDSHKKGRSHAARLKARTHCQHGHEFTKENTYITRTGRMCVTCVKANGRKRYLKWRNVPSEI